MKGKSSAKRWFVALLLAILPTWLIRSVVNKMGHSIEPGAKIGISIILSDTLTMAEGARVGHFNFINVRTIKMGKMAIIGHLNRVNGPIELVLDKRAAIGNRNTISRGPLGVTWGLARLQLGRLSKITANHWVDCTRSVTFGDYTTLAGKGSQIWTHGYVHDEKGPGRYRMDGSVSIGSNVYIGSACFVSMGVTIGDGIVVGGGTSVAKSLSEPGTYVSAAIRRLPRPPTPEQRDDLVAVTDPDLVEPVFEKKGA